MRRVRIDKINSFGGLVLNLVCIVLYFLLAEFVFRFTVLKNINSDLDYYLSQTFSEEEKKNAKQFKDDLDSLGERAVIVPETTVYKYKPAKRKSAVINSLGFRGEEVSAKQRDEYRIAIFGDSKVLGYLLPEEDTMPFLVQEKLREHFRDKNKKISVFNCGIEAFDLQRSIDAAKLYHADLGVDLVVFYSAAIDPNLAYMWGVFDVKPFAKGDMVPEIFRMHIGGDGFNSKLLHVLQSSFLNDIYKFKMKSSNGSDIMTYPIPPLQIKYLEDYPSDYAARVKEVSDYFKQWNTPSVIIMSPMPQLKEPLSEIERALLFQRELNMPGINHFTKKCYSDMVKAVKQLPDVKSLDISEMFNGMKETVFFDGLHMTPSANRMSAEKIAGYFIKIIESEHYLDKK